jgi:uncharacterized protein (DUF1778 family)
METPIMSIRVSPRRRDLIERAAQILDKNRTEYMLDVVCEDAKNVILSQRHFTLDDDAFDRFSSALLEMKGRPNPALDSLLSRPKPWA